MIRLVRRAEPLPVAGVLARGAAAATLARKLRARVPIPSLAVAGAHIAGAPAAIAMGPADALPWVEGALWLGREPEAPALLVPTLLALAPHPSLVLPRLAREGVEPPVALVPSGDRVVAISLAVARAPGAAELDAFVAELAP